MNTPVINLTGAQKLSIVKSSLPCSRSTVALGDIIGEYTCTEVYGLAAKGEKLFKRNLAEMILCYRAAVKGFCLHELIYSS
jgi:predicted oxidoreductase